MRWIITEIATGMERLYCLRLRGCPAADQLQKTTEEWIKSLTRQLGRHAVEQVDAPRLREGFDRLIDNVDFWPTPSMLFKSMPPRPIRHTLPAPDINVEGMEEGKRFLAQIMAKKGGAE